MEIGDVAVMTNVIASYLLCSNHHPETHMRMRDAVGIGSSSDSIIRPALCNLLSQEQRKTDGQTDRQTDMKTDSLCMTSLTLSLELLVTASNV